MYNEGTHRKRWRAEHLADRKYSRKNALRERFFCFIMHMAGGHRYGGGGLPQEKPDDRKDQTKAAVESPLLHGILGMLNTVSGLYLQPWL
jgi:hypothetical protein